MRGERRRPSQVRLDDAETVLVDSGLIDADYVGAQLDTHFDSVHEAARAAFLAGDVSPHPLFEAQWIGRRRSWQRLGQHPVLWYVSERRRRNRISPHPLVDPRIIFATHPEARHHPYGALSYWLSVSGPGTALPTRILPKKVSWGTYRAAAIEAAAAWRREVVLERPELVGPTPALPAALGTSPAVTVVMATQDAGALVRETVASLQAQSFTDWHLVAVDRGSLDDTAAVLQGMAAFDDRITVVRESRCSHARALNVALEHGTAEHVAFLPLGRQWLPDMLGSLVAHAHHSGASAVLAGAGAVGRDRAELLGGRPVDLATALLRRAAIKDVGGFDESLGGSVERDLMLRLSRDHDPLPVDVPVLKRPDPGPHDLGDDWDSVVLERQLVDWDAAPRTTSDDLVTHVMPLGPEPRRTVEWLSSVPREGSELILVGVRLRRAHHVLAASIAAIISGARFVSVPASVTMSAATNIGISQAAGSTVLLVRPEAMPPRQPIAARLAEVVHGEGVAVAQPLVVDLDGVVLSAGARFNGVNPHPGLFLAGLPTSDAVRIGQSAVAAPAAPLVALRTEDAVALRGLDAAVPLGARRDRPRAARPSGGPGRQRRRTRHRHHLAHALRGRRRADRGDVVAEPHPDEPDGGPRARPAAPRGPGGHRRAQPPDLGRPRGPRVALGARARARPAPGAGHPRVAAPAPVGDRHRRARRAARRPVGRHLLRPVARRRAREPRAARGHRPARRARARLTRPRRRAPRAARSRPGGAAPGPAQRRVDHQPPRHDLRRGGRRLRPRLRRQHELVGADDPRVGHPDRAAAAVHRHPVVPPRPGRARHRPGAALRRQLARRLPLRRPQRARHRRRPHPPRQRLDRVRRARADRLGRRRQPRGRRPLRLRRHRAQRPPPRHAARQLRLQPALRRRRLRGAHPQRPHRRPRGDLLRARAPLRQRARAGPPGARRPTTPSPTTPPAARSRPGSSPSTASTSAPRRSSTTPYAASSPAR